MRLLRGSNAALFEWLQSPVVYHEALAFRARLAPLLPAAFNLKAGLHHYLGQLRRGVEEELADPKVRLKRLFYALRAALAAHWIRTRHTLPPMEFAALRQLLPAPLAEEVNALLARKATADEKTVVARPALLVAFLQEELAAGQATRESLPVRQTGGAAAGPDGLDGLFRELLQAAGRPELPPPGA